MTDNSKPLCRVWIAELGMIVSFQSESKFLGQKIFGGNQKRQKKQGSATAFPPSPHLLGL